jgi:hypothetical protein
MQCSETTRSGSSKKVCGIFVRGEPDQFGFLGGREQDFLVSQEQAVALVTTFTYLNTDGSVYTL